MSARALHRCPNGPVTSHAARRSRVLMTAQGIVRTQMATAVKTTTTELGDSRVRVEVEVPSEALEQELRSAAAELGRELRIPGFRKGKVPGEVVLRQVGREAVMDEAVRRGLPAWYEQAIGDAGINAVGDPKLD